jgi:hypothetical protein
MRMDDWADIQPSVDSPYYPFWKVQSANAMAGAETLPYILSRYLMDMERPGYTPPSDNRYPRARLKKLLYWDGENPLSQPLPTDEQIRTILFDPALPADPPDKERGYRVYAQDLVRQSQYTAQSFIRIVLGEVSRIQVRNEAVFRQTIIYTIMTNYSQEANLGTPGNSRSYAMMQAILEATEGVNIGGVGSLFMSRVTKVDDERANLGYKLYQYIDWHGSDEHPTYAD